MKNLLPDNTYQGIAYKFAFGLLIVYTLGGFVLGLYLGLRHHGIMIGIAEALAGGLLGYLAVRFFYRHLFWLFVAAAVPILLWILI